MLRNLIKEGNQKPQCMSKHYCLKTQLNSHKNLKMVKNEKLRILRKYLVKKEEEQKDGPYSYLVPSRYLNFKKYLKL